MANELETKGNKKAKRRSIEEIMRDPVAWGKLQNLVDEAVGCKQKIQLAQEDIKAIRDVAIQELGVAPPIFNDYVAAVFNNDYQARKENLEQRLALVDGLMDSSKLPS